ncbi:class C sortase [Nocardioides kongjuensis]|uniref:Sortase A n=1 Tax=Nocardioides kongjuensis TaxID=349522 RepID=A0A852RPX1_9ACTN|nr:class C sortase [Nocardioides kongjuensis]NYD32749.1 sortase A [Nocardioides kongjuensis]
MSTIELPRSAASAAPPPRPRRTRRWRGIVTAWTIRRALVVVLGMAGFAVLLYPSAGAWFTDRAHASVVSGYAETVKSMTPESIRQQLHAAHQYNKHLPKGPLRDPYSSSGAGQETALGSDAKRYLDTLNVVQGGMMGVLSIGGIGVTLPVFHGTGASTLDKGVGHLYGTALPVGGRGTHSVLTGHSGIAGVTLFTHLHEMQLGDTFTVTVLDRTLTYQVDQIKTVLPEETEDLEPIAGEDHITLVTCTPIGVNSHRLLVRGIRIPTPKSVSPPAFIAGKSGPGFPWWILEACGGLVVLLLISSPLGRRAPRRSEGSGR